MKQKTDFRRNSPVPGLGRLDRAVKEAIKHHTIQKVGQITIHVKSGMLFIELPSGRHLSYVKPAIGENRFGGESVTYFGIDDKKKWSRIESYGPKFVENITQAICRDILCNAMQNLSDQFICGHVHDELLIEVPDGTPFQPICDRMAAAPDWLPGIILRADGGMMKYYRKD